MSSLVYFKDVVVTTYGMMQGELRRKNPVLSQCSWLRVVLDEAHCIRNQRTLASKVCCSLKAKHRWCVSGTIIQNSLEDVLGIMKFLQHEPWCWPAFWKVAITAPSKVDNPDLDPTRRDESLKVALNRVRRLLGPIMLRRTEQSLTKAGKPILTLPPIETKLVKVDLSETEREFYNAVLARSQEVFEGFIESKSASQAYFQIFSLLQRLRQCCDHIALTVKNRIDGEDFIEASQDSANQETSSLTTDSQQHVPKSKALDALGKKFLDGLLQKFCLRQSSPRKDRKRDADESDRSSKRLKDQAYVESVAQTLSQAVANNDTHMSEECAICLETPRIDEAVFTPCAHVFCHACLIDVLRRQAPKVAGGEGAVKPSAFVHIPDGLCPTCQEKIEAKRIIVLTKSSTDESDITPKLLFDLKPTSRPIKRDTRESDEGSTYAGARHILANAVSGNDSSKMTAVLDELHAVWALDPGSKVLIFSHYLGFLDLLEKQMGQHDIPFFRLDGSLSLKERMNVLDQFRTTGQAHISTSASARNSPSSVIGTKKGSVLLISMSAGGEGLNIVSASTCFILEPWWNGAREDQCIKSKSNNFPKRALLLTHHFNSQESTESGKPHPLFASVSLCVLTASKSASLNSRRGRHSLLVKFIATRGTAVTVVVGVSQWMTFV